MTYFGDVVQSQASEGYNPEADHNDRVGRRIPPRARTERAKVSRVVWKPGTVVMACVCNSRSRYGTGRPPIQVCVGNWNKVTFDIDAESG